MLDVLSNNPPPLRGQPDELRDLLADPANASVSNREIGRRIGLDHRYIAGYRAALAHRGEGPAPHAAMLADGAGTTPATFPGRWQHTPSMPGLTVAFEPPALNSLDCWALAAPAERTKFVDAVGLAHLLEAAPPDHRDAFRRTIKTDGAR